MERLSYEFTNALAQKTRVLLIANRHGKKALPVFLLWAAWKLRELAPRADVVHLGDPLLSILIPFLPTPRKPVAVTVHGLDIRYRHPLYQALIRRFLPRVDLALCISRFVEQDVHKRFPTLRTQVISPGLQESFARARTTKTDLERALKRTFGPDPLLLAVARLVPRKGIAWFVEEVLPNIPRATLLVIGDGREREHVARAAARMGVSERLVLAGSVSKETLALAYNVADLLVMPNIPVPGDAEGFGLVALEAASAGLFVVASELEGVADAVVPSETGMLVSPAEKAAWVGVLQRLLTDDGTRARLRQRAPETVRERFSWDRRAEDTLEAFARLAEERRTTSQRANRHRT